MKITWSLPVRGGHLDQNRADLVRARCLIDALRADGHQVRVVEDATDTVEQLAVSAYHVVRSRLVSGRHALMLRDLGRWLHARRHASRVVAEARKQKADLIIETQVHFTDSGALAAHASGLPLVLDGCSTCDEELFLSTGLPALARHLLKRQTRAASAVVAVTRVVRSRLVWEGVDARKIRIVPNGVDFAAYRAVDRKAARERLGLHDRLVLGFVGSFQPWHRAELLVEALAQLVSRHPAHLVLVGDGPGLKHALAASDRLGVRDRVAALGAVPSSRVPELISAFDIAVLPGANDYGNPLKLFEYAAAGVASIAPDLDTIREVIDDGITGLLFPAGDAGALAVAIERLGHDEGLRGDLGRKAKRAVMESASWSHRSRRLVSDISKRRTDAGSGRAHRK